MTSKKAPFIDYFSLALFSIIESTSSQYLEVEATQKLISQTSPETYLIRESMAKKSSADSNFMASVYLSIHSPALPTSITSPRLFGSWVWIDDSLGMILRS